MREPVTEPCARLSAALRAHERRDVLNYWLTLVRYQEALGARPRARRPIRGGQLLPNLAEPARGQDYAKIPFEGAWGFLVEKRGQLDLAFDEERCAFFEDWLSTRYRRGETEEVATVEHLVCFPSVHLPRGELAGLLRFEARGEWREDSGAGFKVPSWAQRKAAQLGQGPSALRLQAPDTEPEEGLPFFVDAKLLRETLRIDAEALSDFFVRLRGGKVPSCKQVLTALCALIEQQSLLERAEAGASALKAEVTSVAQVQEPSAEATARDLLVRLERVIRERLAKLGSKARVFPVALLINTDRMRATWHLQRDLSEALQLEQGAGLPESSPLHAYLAGAPGSEAEALFWGRWGMGGLTPSQERACRRFWGSQLTAVQGPPGTGKTTLILNALAATLVQKVMALRDGGAMSDAITVVTSTNNQAVDNVVNPLARDWPQRQLPLALRVGSREVIEKISAPDLERAYAWLERQPDEPEAAKQALEQALQRFEAVRRELLAELAPLADCHAAASKLAAAQLEVTRLVARQQARALEPAAKVELPQANPASPAQLATALASLLGRLKTLSELTAAPAGTALEGKLALGRVHKHWKRLHKRELVRVSRALGFPLELGLPPGLADEGAPAVAQLELWEERVERSVDLLQELQAALTLQRQQQADERRLLELREQTAQLTLEVAQARSRLDRAGPMDDAGLTERHQKLFEAAVEARERWAVRHRPALLKVLKTAAKHCRHTRSLKTLLEDKSPVGEWLRQLFPAWGCTLLSLGNVFPACPGAVDRLVIDEAGQCHSAYAVSGLLRARSALVIGDVHQLEPVIGVSADDERRIVRSLNSSLAEGQLAPYRVYDDSQTSAQSVADRAVSERLTLIDHFRCQSQIVSISERLCGYGLVTRTPPSSRSAQAPFLHAPVLFEAIEGDQERFAGSWINRSEVQALLHWVQRILATGIAAEDVGVITPYRGQLEYLWRALREARVPLARPTTAEPEFEELGLFGPRDRGLALGTVHRFQGGERSIILFSTTLTRVPSLGFVDDRVNLLNVAVSRAREHLITLGHAATLKAGRRTRHLLEAASPLQAGREQ